MFYTDSAYNDIKRGWLDGKGDSMITVLLKAGSLTFIIILGILLRRMQPLPDHSGQVVKKVLLYITLPMAVVVNFSSMAPFVNYYRFLNLLKNSLVFSFCGCPKISSLLPSSSMTPSAMKITWLDTSRAKAIS